MRYNLRLKGSSLWKMMSIVVMVIVITCCATEFISVTQPTSAKVNETINVQLKLKYNNVDGGQSGKMIVAVLMPTGWRGRENMTMTYTSPAYGDGTFEPTPLSDIDPASPVQATYRESIMTKFGLVGNFVNDMEWVVFQSDKSYGFKNGNVTVDIKMKVGVDDNNANVKLAYLTSNTGNGIKDIDEFLDKKPPNEFEYVALRSTPVLEVTGGSGDFIDYASPQLSTIDPSKALIDDFVTISFEGGVQENPLFGSNEVYFKSTAYTKDGTSYEVFERTAKTKMPETFVDGNIYKLTLWPRSYYNIPSSKTIDRIEYTFTDAAGAKEVGRKNTPEKFVYKFKCI